jgi:hypothetical protein
MSVEDSKALETGIDSVRQWCGQNGMEFNIKRTKIMPFTRK